MPRFVLLDHDHPSPHLDFMLEAGGVLWTWRLDVPPRPGEPRPALRIFDHRTHYLDYEGPVSGGRGSVHRRDWGTFDWVEQADHRLVARLRGQLLQGRLTLRRAEGDSWLVVFEPQPRALDNPAHGVSEEG